MNELQKTDILAEIIATKRKELAARVEAHAGESDLRAIPFEGVQAQRSRSLRRALLASPTGIIARSAGAARREQDRAEDENG